MADRAGRVMTTEAPLLFAGEILRATGGALFTGGSEWSCRGISTDTRTLRERNLFIALPGKNFDGHDPPRTVCHRVSSSLAIVRSSKGNFCVPMIW